MEEKIMTKHPDKEKEGVKISKAKYDLVRKAILKTLREKEGITYKELGKAVNEKLAGTFDGSITWYVSTIKLDLEARNEIEQIGEGSPQRLRLVKK